MVDKEKPPGVSQGDITGVLKDREESHGDYSIQAVIVDRLREVMYSTKNWYDLSSVQRDVLLVIAQKISRVLSGNPDFEDHWIDICGYSQLVLKDLRK